MELTLIMQEPIRECLRRENWVSKTKTKLGAKLVNKKILTGCFEVRAVKAISELRFLASKEAVLVCL